MRKLKEILKYRLTPALFLFALFIASSGLLSSFSDAAPSPSPVPSQFLSESPPPIPTASPVVLKPPVPMPAKEIIPKLQLINSAPSYRFVSATGLPLPDYDYGKPVPESRAAEDDFFADTVFLGDSRTEGFRLYSGLKSADILAAKCISVMNIFSEDVISDGSGGYVSIMDALGWNTYTKVYVMLGINELGFNPDTFIEKYASVVDAIREIQPGAEIYLQAIIPVTQETDNSGSLFTNSRICLFNTGIADLAAQKGLHYIDTFSALCNEEGFLPDEASFDGIHLYKDFCAVWLSYLKTHTAVSCR